LALTSTTITDAASRADISRASDILNLVHVAVASVDAPFLFAASYGPRPGDSKLDAKPARRTYGRCRVAPMASVHEPQLIFD
jgi:hypothetical protein